MIGVISSQHKDEGHDCTLSEYISKMKDIRTGSSYLDTLTFKKSAAALEQEVTNLKRAFAQEITRLRSEMKTASTTVFQHEHQHKQLEKSTADVQQRIEDAMNRNRELEDGCNELRNAVNNKEQEMSRLEFDQRQQASNPTHSVTSEGQLAKAMEENSRLKHMLGEEVTNNRVIQDRVRELQHQSEFNTNVGEQQCQDLQSRLSASSNAILSLEERVRHLNAFNKDEHVALMLSTIKDTSQRELSAYKQDTEVAFDRNVTMLKAQVDTDRKTYEAVTAENRRLVCCVEELNTKIRNLQAELMHLTHSKCAADENLVMEKDSAARQSQALEVKLSDMQNNVMDKMTELNIVKCENLPLKTESAGLRALIEEEKERMSMDIRPDRLDSMQAPTSHTYAPVATAALLTMDPFVPSATSGVPVAAPAVIPGSPEGVAAGSEAIQSSTTFCSGHRSSIRAHSAPVSRQSATKAQHRMATEELGQGRSYFNELFKQRTNISSEVQSAGLTRQRVHFDRSNSSKSSLGALTIHEISRDGRYIMLHNSCCTDLEFGGSSIKQNIGGVPVAEFTFPNRMTFRAGSFVTVFAGVCSSTLHQPPQQFVYGDEQKWGIGPECTTVLCNASGKAVAWINATHRQANMSAQSECGSSSNIQTIQMLTPPQSSKGHTDTSTGISVGLKRNPANEEEHGSLLDRQKRRPHTANPICKSPVTRPLHSASGQRMGSAPMRKFSPSIGGD